MVQGRRGVAIASGSASSLFVSASVKVNRMMRSRIPDASAAASASVAFRRGITMGRG
jgi:hypothetical protein